MTDIKGSLSGDDDKEEEKEEILDTQQLQQLFKVTFWVFETFCEI
jgi:hypothetical protein